MNGQRFDDFTRLLARGVSRRTVLTVLGSVTGALLGGLGSRAIALSLVRTGAIDRTPLGREHLRKTEDEA